MSQSVRAANADLVTLSVQLNGAAMPDHYQVLALSTDHALNAIPTATLTLQDGDLAIEDFPASASDDFAPGVEITLQAGYHGQNRTIFTGVILRQTISLGPDGSTALTLTCFDKALKTTRSGGAAVFADYTDADAMQAVIANAGLGANVASTAPTKEHHVQDSATDWDFVLNLAQANGHVIRVQDGSFHIGPPRFDDAQFFASLGDSLIEVDLDLDATAQWPGVSASAWDPANGSVLTATASEPSVNRQGNITGKKLSLALGAQDSALKTDSTADHDALKSWADAQLLYTRLARITGTVTCPGNADLGVDTLLDLKGLGPRFNGAAYISGVRHTLSGGDWTSTLTLGLPPAPAATPQPARAAIHGLQIAKVLQIHDDPDGERRVKVSLPLVPDSQGGIWVRLASPYASNGAGFTFMPEQGDEVVLGFLGGDANSGIILGALHASSRPAAIPPDEENSRKAIVSREGLKLSFDDAHKTLSLETPGGHQITLNDETGHLTMTDVNANSITMDETGMTLTSSKDITLSAPGLVSISGASGVDIGSSAHVSLQATTIEARAEASAELSSDGVTTITGSIVNIN